jgi:hypothetical protein
MDKSPFPPNVVIYIQELISRRTEYKVRLEHTEVYYGYDDFSKRQNQQKRDSLQHNITNLTQSIVAVTRKHFPSIEVDGDEEVTITNVLASLPPPEEVILKRVYHSNS